MSAGHYPADLRWRDGGFDTSCACGATWPCPGYVPPAPVASAPRPALEPGDLCPDCGEITGFVLRDHRGSAVCPDCDESWLHLPPPSACRVLWEDGELYLNEEWVGSVGPRREGEVGSCATWLRGRGWDDARHRTVAEAQAALIERVAREIGAEGGEV